MSDLHDILACPRCDGALTNFRCSACRVDYPVTGGVPWLFADPDASQADWRNRWNMALAELARQQQACELALRNAQSPASRQRLATLASGCAAQRAALQSLLEELDLGRVADQSTYLALKTRLPTQVGLLSYSANVFRDWCWGDQENAASLSAVTAAMADVSPRRVLVLGAGAGRLAYDLHRTVTPELTVALDVNPYLSTLCRKLADSAALTLTEFPLAPRSPAQYAISRELKAPAAAGPGFVTLLADALRVPCKAGTFDLVVTPWLLDVIDAPVAEFLARVNHLLNADGAWINHGSLAFNHPDPAQCPSLDEVIEIAQGQGFGALSSSEVTMPYLDCPDSRHGRVESVVTLSGRKFGPATVPPRHQSLPDWIAKGRTPVPLLPAFQTQAMTTRMHAFIMTLIDGKRTLKDIAQVLEDQQLLARAEAEVALRGFLIKMYEEAGHQGL